MTSTFAAAGDIWGIDGQMFLIGYAVLAVVVGVAGTAVRKRLAAPPREHPGADIATRPFDIALLNGGSELAVLSALSAMHMRGTITATQGSVRAARRLDPRADELERAIHNAAGNESVRRKRLPAQHPVGAALAAMEQRLVGVGLLLSAEQRRRIRRVSFAMLALAVLGLARLLAGLIERQNVAVLAGAIVVVTAVAIVQFVKVPTRSANGDRTLAALRSQHFELAPGSTPNWAVYGPVAAALGIGIFGPAALWASAPTLAQALATKPPSSASNTGDSGGDSSSCGGGGGD